MEKKQKMVIVVSSGFNDEKSSGGLERRERRYRQRFQRHDVPGQLRCRLGAQRRGG